MNKIFLVATLVLSVSWSSISFSKTKTKTGTGVETDTTCYTVEGEVKTINISEASQLGSIDILLYDENDNESFRGAGTITGTITGGGYGYTLLTHVSSFEDGSTFVTSGDLAAITGVRNSAELDTPCSFFINEHITHIASGAGFFANAHDIDIHAVGYINACIADGDNENEFELKGTLCLDD